MALLVCVFLNGTGRGELFKAYKGGWVPVDEELMLATFAAAIRFQRAAPADVECLGGVVAALGSAISSGPACSLLTNVRLEPKSAGRLLIAIDVRSDGALGYGCFRSLPVNAFDGVRDRRVVEVILRKR